MNVQNRTPSSTPARDDCHRAAVLVVSALETGLTALATAADGTRSLSFTFADDLCLQAAHDAWRAYALFVMDEPATLPQTVAQRAAAQIGLALFGDPTLDLIQLSNRVAEMRAASEAPLLDWTCSR